MKLLHTGDLHLGKTLHETPLIDDQKSMLEQLIAELARDDYAALLIAGDIYDRTIPGADAVELFSSFLGNLRTRFPDLAVCFIPGNHDSAQRLGFADTILKTRNIHVVSDPEQSFHPLIITGKTGERTALFLLPFLAAGTLSPEKLKEENGEAADAQQTTRVAHATTEPKAGEFDFGSKDDDASRTRSDSGAGNDEHQALMSQGELAAEASRRFSRVLSTPEMKQVPTVLVAHLYTQGGLQSDSERAFLGTAERVSPELFRDFSYVALGHLHRPQKAAERMYYAGSPLAYSFDEAGDKKAFLKVEIDCAAPGFPATVTQIPVKPDRAVVRLSGAFEDFYSKTTHDRHAADYLEITLTDEGMVANPMNLLRPKFPWLLSIRQGQCASGTQGSNGDGDAGRAEPAAAEAKRDPAADFDAFQIMLRGEADQQKSGLFRTLLKEASDEA